MGRHSNLFQGLTPTPFLKNTPRLSYQWNGKLALNVSGFQKTFLALFTIHIPLKIQSLKLFHFRHYVFPVLTNPFSWFSCCCTGTNPYSPPSSFYQHTNIGKQIRNNACFKDCLHHCQMKPSLCSHHNLKEGQHIIFVCVNSAYRLEEFVNTIIKPHISTFKTQILTRKHVGSINQNHLKNKRKLNDVT